MVQTKYPISMYVLLAAVGSIGLLLWGDSWQKIAFYTGLVALGGYLLTGRYACRITLTPDTLHIHYLFPWYKDVSMNRRDITEVSYQKGFYAIFSDRSLGGLFVFPTYSYDQLIILSTTQERQKRVDVLNINTRLFGFDKIYKTLVNEDKNHSD